MSEVCQECVRECAIVTCDTRARAHAEVAKTQGAAEERKAIVQWLYSRAFNSKAARDFANLIALGDHIKQETKPNE